VILAAERVITFGSAIEELCELSRGRDIGQHMMNAAPLDQISGQTDRLDEKTNTVVGLNTIKQALYLDHVVPPFH
jgi:hypothetical protein